MNTTDCSFWPWDSNAQVWIRSHNTIFCEVKIDLHIKTID